MNQEVIRDFLNVPGVVGIALLSGHSEPVFYSNNSAFALRQQELLAQSILQVIETIPAEYEVLEFCFAENQIMLYRLPRKIIVLVIKNDSCVMEKFAEAFQVVRSWLEKNSATPFEPFQPLPTVQSPALKDLIDALNHLSQFTTNYLGVAVIVNYLKASCPTTEWMAQFQVARSGQVSFLGELSELEQAVSVQEHEWFRAWVEQFIRRCSHAVRNYAVLVEQKALTDTQKALLLP